MWSRRETLLAAAGIALALPGDAAGGGEEPARVAPPVFRISRGRFAPSRIEAVHARLDAAAGTLVPAIRALPGCLHFWAGIDAVSSTMINASVWRTLADAERMGSLEPMLALAREFSELGVTFERPIPNYEVIWRI